MGAAVAANIGPALAAAVAAWLFGAVYYGVLGRLWVEAQGKTMDQLKIEHAGKGRVAMVSPFILSFVALFVMALVLSGILFHLGNFTMRAGMISGVLVWFGFVLTTIAVNNAFSSRRPMLTLIDGGHWLGALLIMGAVLGAMGG